MANIAIIGSGISGLAAAYYLTREGHKVTVFERSDRIGGAIQTMRRGTEIMEAGPDSLLTSKPEAIDLARELGVELVESCAQGPPGVVKDGRVLPLPDGFKLLAPTRMIPFALTRLLSLRGKLRAAAELFIPTNKDSEDESVADFVSRRFGNEILERLAQPLIGGIYSADPRELSLKATFGFLRMLEQSQGSVIKGMLAAGSRRKTRGSLFWAPRNGMGELVDTLVERIGPDNIRQSRTVERVVRDRKHWVVECEDKEEGFDGMVLACPAHKAAELLEQQDPDLATGLSKVAYTSTATIHLLFDKKQVEREMTGSGFVVPHVEGLDITACTYAHRKYPGRAGPDKALLRVHLGGRLNENVLSKDDSQLSNTAIETLRPLLGLTGNPLTRKVVRHHKVVPQYSVGHLDVRKKLDNLVAHHPTLALGGNGLHGVGLADCVKQAAVCAKSLHKEVC
jgi:protoporphyrinogen/coproporphyrinogen III oxidase